MLDLFSTPILRRVNFGIDCGIENEITGHTGVHHPSFKSSGILSVSRVEDCVFKNSPRSCASLGEFRFTDSAIKCLRLKNSLTLLRTWIILLCTKLRQSVSKLSNLFVSRFISSLARQISSTQKYKLSMCLPAFPHPLIRAKNSPRRIEGQDELPY